MFQYEGFPESITSRPAVCSWGPARLDCFWNESGALMHRWFDTNGWHAAETLTTTAPLASDPAACCWGDQRIDLFWREASGRLHHKWFDHGWQGEETFGASMRSGPGAASWGTQRIDVFWTDTAGILHQKWYDHGWQGETSFPVDITTDPAVAAWGAGRLDLFWRDSSAALRHKWYDGSWHQDESLGGTFEGAPAVCAWATGILDIFVRNSANQLWHRWYDQGWHDWRMREGTVTAPPGVTSWSDGRIDLFAQSSDGKLWHGWYGGNPLVTHAADVKSLWGFLDTYAGPDKVERIHQSFASGLLNGDCSGIMISPHIFMTASHCGGPGWTGGVNFYHLDQLKRPPDDANQQLSPTYLAHAFPWQDSGIGSTTHHGDTCLWWLQDGPDGLPPGLKYGYVALSPDPVTVGTVAYSFWSNPALRLNDTLLYSEGPATAIHEADPGDWRGSWTDYAMWTIPGASGSANLAATHGNQVVGVTQGGPGGGGVERSVVNTAAFLGRYDPDGDQILDPVSYDWLFTEPRQSFYLFDFQSPFARSRWVAVPNGSATNAGQWGRLTGFPEMTCTPATQNPDGYWNQFARFERNRRYRISLAASGTATGPIAAGAASYLSWISDSSGDVVAFRLTPQAAVSRITGTVTLGPHDDYRMIIGTSPNTTLHLESIALVADGLPFGFSTHDERRSWEYIDTSRPMSWGTQTPASFSGVVVGPTPHGWGIRNRFLALLPNTNYTLGFTVVRRGATGTGGYARVEDLAGNVVGEHRWTFGGVAPQIEQFSVSTGPGPGKAIVFGADDATTYCVSDLVVT